MCHHIQGYVKNCIYLKLKHHTKSTSIFSECTNHARTRKASKNIKTLVVEHSKISLKACIEHVGSAHCNSLCTTQRPQNITYRDV